MAASTYAPRATAPLAASISPGMGRHAMLADLVPGLAQWRWDQRERGFVIFGTFAAAMAMSIFCWGSGLGWVFLTLAFLTHLASSIDVVRQLAFPVFRPVVAISASGLSLAAGLYLPLALTLFLLAFPVHSTELGAGYLVNRLAYRSSHPSPGDWVWFRLTHYQAERAGQVLAIEGQEVEWTGRRWQVDGRDLPAHPGSLPYFPDGWRFSIPKGCLLVGPESPRTEPSDSSPLMIIGRDRVMGRAWVKCSPFWERALL